VSIRFVTFTGGDGSTGVTHVSALRMNTGGETGQIIIDNDIFKANTGGYYVVEIGDSSLVQLDSSLFYGNSGAAAFGVNSVAKLFAINNTFAQNALSFALLVYMSDSGSSANLGNNIFFDTVYTEIHFGSAGTAQLSHNVMPIDVLNTFTTDGAMVSEDDVQVPDIQFASGTDFHLQATSPGIAEGTLTPPNYNQPGGALPTLDIEGNPRTYNGAVDMGAYERGNNIFKDGFGF
jgi:hypothetical protein